MAHLRCPTCGFKLAIWAQNVPVDDCPRCAARGRRPAPMVLCQGSRGFPAREFTGWKYPARPASPHQIQSYTEVGE